MATITGTESNDVLNGTADNPANGSGTFGDDTIYGLGGDDIIDGMGGADTIDAGSGNDTVKVTVFGPVVRSEKSSYDGGTGFDTLDLTSITSGLNISTVTGISFGNNANRQYDAVNFERLILGGADDLVGGGSAMPTTSETLSEIYLGGGNDLYTSGSFYLYHNSNATVHGGDGDDRLGSTASMYGDAGNDLLANAPNYLDRPPLYSNNAYTFIGQHSASEFNDGFVPPADGSVVIDGGTGIDILVFDYGSIDLTNHVAVTRDGQTVYVTSIENLVGLGTARGNAGDNVFVTQGDVTVSGEAGNDAILLERASGTIDGGSGDDVIFTTHVAQSSTTKIAGGTGNDTSNFDFAASAATIATEFGKTTIDYYASDTVLIRYTVTGVEHLVFTDTTLERNDGAALFDSTYYLSRNSDVATARVDSYGHYDQFGWREGRDPEALFSTTGYLASNADVERADINPLTHFVQYGWKEGRDPSAAFDTTLYLIHNPDVAAAGVDPLEHYLIYGMSEGRTSYAAIGSGIYANGFDPEYYLLANADVARDAANTADPNAYAYAHYEQVGWKEGRNPNGWFDDKGYLAAYQDVAAASVNPLDHYAEYGWHEGRDPSAQFDTRAYIAAYQDVAAAGINPLLHYLQYGAYEQRNTFADGAFHT